MSISQDTINHYGKKVLFSVPITKIFIEQFVVSLILTGHCSERGVVEILRDLFDYHISVANVHNIIARNVEKAQKIQETEDLSLIRVGAHDEIFQGRKPSLGGCDAVSTFCFLLSEAQARDGDTWGIHLLQLKDRGLQPDYTIADFGKGLRAGQAEAWPDTPCFADVFHALQDLGRVAIYHENKAYGLLAQLYALEAKMKRAKKHKKGNQLSKKLVSTRYAVDNALKAADHLAILNQWLQADVLALIGADLGTRYMLFDFIMQELEKLEPLGSSHIKKVRCKLENQRTHLLIFAHMIDQKLLSIAEKFKIDPFFVRRLFELQAIPHDKEKRWIEDKSIRKQLHHLYHPVQKALLSIKKEIIRASSVIENLNSRIRNYFFLRKSFGQGSLDLLRFYLNHKSFMRSYHPERVGKSPAELMTGKPHVHWLEMLGFTRYKQAVA